MPLWYRIRLEQSEEKQEEAQGKLDFTLGDGNLLRVNHRVK